MHMLKGTLISKRCVTTFKSLQTPRGRSGSELGPGTFLVFASPSKKHDPKTPQKNKIAHPKGGCRELGPVMCFFVWVLYAVKREETAKVRVHRASQTIAGV